MREDLRLFINGQEVEFSVGPKILYNYKLTELNNPTVVRNSFSKQVEIPNTERNSDIFGHIWNLERVQYDAVGGAGFNPLKKVPFELYADGNLKEKGYCKLDNIKKTGNDISFCLTLYGGLGTFLYSLAYDETSGDEKPRTLADLKFNYLPNNIVTNEANLDFQINKETVLTAWDTLSSGGIKPAGFTPSGDTDWEVINFAPCYNGIPSDFDADKTLFNHSGFLDTVIDAEDLTYHTVYNGSVITADTQGKGYSLGTMGEPLTEWEIKDLRSYLQRPVLNVQRTILSMKDPSINGGYDFQLSPKFFNTSHRGNDFYWNKAWMTLPMLKDLEIEGGSEAEITGATMSSGTSENTKWVINFTTPQGLGKVNGVRIVMEPRLIMDSGDTQYDELHFSHKWSSDANCINPKTIKWFKTESVYIMQMIARNADREIIAQSPAYYFSESQKFPDGSYVYKYFWKEGDEGVKPEFIWRNGYFKKFGNEYRFVAADSQQTWSVAFEIPAGLDITFLELKTMTALGVDAELKWFGGIGDTIKKLIPEEYMVNSSSTYTALYNVKNKKRHACWEAEQVINDGLDTPRVYPHLNSFYGKALDYESMFSDTYITKTKLLSTPFTPSDFLLSFAKIFGMYLYYDPTEVSSKPDIYPNGVIHLLDRTEYYHMFDGEYTEPIVDDLNKLIDRSKPMEIVPAVASSKFYKFEQEPVESEGNKNYYDTYGHNYGRQLVNTGYNFDNSVNDLYDGNVFKSAVMCLEKDKYFKTKASNGMQCHVNACYNTYVYNLYNTSLSPKEETVTNKAAYSGKINSSSALTGYDLFPKMQFHTASNEASDGAYVLCSFVGTATCVTGGEYIMTDDVIDMVYLNSGKPCWITANSTFIKGNRIAWPINKLPVFSRDLWMGNNFDGIVINSWNFGHPREILTPFTYSTDGDSIYDKYWKNYIGDLYSVNDRKLSCYVNLPDKPFPGAMRKFYWFDNSIWRLNEVKDWNVFGYDSTQCEFIKVQDIEDYKTPVPSDAGVVEMFVSPKVIPHGGGNVTITIKNQTGQELFSDDNFHITGLGSEGSTFSLDTPYIHDTSISGTYITFTIGVPAYYTTEEIEWKFEVIDTADVHHKATFKQLGGSIIIDGTIDDWNYWETDPRSVQVYAVPAALGFTVTKTDPGYNFNMNVYRNNITITPHDENDGGNRTATIKVTNGNDTKSFTVTQKGYPSEPYINVYLPPAFTSDLLVVTNIAQDKNQYVDSNVLWTVTASGGNWLTAEKVDNRTVKVSVTANNTGNERWGSVTLTDGHISKTFSVLQTG